MERPFHGPIILTRLSQGYASICRARGRGASGIDDRAFARYVPGASILMPILYALSACCGAVEWR